MHAMALQPEERSQSARELLDELYVPTTEAVAPQPVGVTSDYTAPVVSVSQPASLRWRLLGGMAALLLLLGMALGLGSWVAGGLQKRADTRATGTAQATLSSQLTSSSAVQASQTQQAEKLTATAAAQAPPGMVLIPAGEFQMGSESGEGEERPAHTVYLDTYYIDIFEVTNTLYKKCVQAGACSVPRDTRYYLDISYAQHPVVNVDWHQARAYCQWRGGDLPSEAQWEKAARGGLEGKDYPWGDEAPVCTPGAANGAQFISCGSQTVDVGSFGSNGYDLYDMAGNVYEWVLDWYQADYYASSLPANPSGPAPGGYRVLRGGSWDGSEGNLRVAGRSYYVPGGRYLNVGFRCSFSP